PPCSLSAALSGFLRRRPARSPPFPYTTLFRSVFEASRTLGASIPMTDSAGRVHSRAVSEPLPESSAPSTTPASRRKSASCISTRSEEHTSELQSRFDLVCRLLLEKKKNKTLR